MDALSPGENLPISLITTEIRRGVEDGSIRNKKKPELLYLIAWATVTGYVKLNVAAGIRTRNSLLKGEMQEWKDYQKQVRASILLKDD